MARSAKFLLLAASVLAVTASSSTAATPTRAPILGVVPKASTPHALSKSALSTAGFLTFDANYESLINQYFADVAHDSGLSSNVYSIATQYYDTGYPGSGPVQYQSTVGGSYVDNDPLPANGCDDGQDSVCLTDAQLQTEIQNVLTAKGWPGSTSRMFFLLTPNGVGSCFDGTGAECTTNVYCAYHSSFTDSNGEQVIYANEPYNATITGCDSGSSPNNDDADSELNTISHEHNEAITDPFGDAWYAADGEENGDLCAWGFGTPLGGTGLGEYNQVINGDHYWLQQEWSNEGRDCLQNATQESPPQGSDLVYHGGLVMHTNSTYAIYWLPTPGNTGLPVVTGTAAVNDTLTSSAGSWNGSPTGYSFQWQRCSAGDTGCANISGASGSTYTLTAADGGKYVRSTVRAANVNGSSGYVASGSRAVAPLPIAVVPPLPTATAAPAVSGVAAVGKELTTTSGAWTTSASFAYQWLRCAADGSGCATISGATSATYIAVTADAGHRLAARVSATNAGGTASSTSAATAVVIGAPHVSKAPRISGRARVGRRLSARRGTWDGPPTSYRYQWLRCSRSGARCVRIRKATRVRYRLTKHDVGHRLRVRVTAANVAGSKAATSRSTKRVPAVRRRR